MAPQGAAERVRHEPKTIQSESGTLKNTRDNGLSDRRKATADAKKTLLDNYRKAKEAAEPHLAAKQAERVAVATAREERRAERERAKAEEREKLLAAAKAEAEAADAEARAEAEARLEAETSRISRVIEDEAARKAKRDQRYANRKARQS